MELSISPGKCPPITSRCACKIDLCCKFIETLTGIPSSRSALPIPCAWQAPIQGSAQAPYPQSHPLLRILGHEFSCPHSRSHLYPVGQPAGLPSAGTQSGSPGALWPCMIPYHGHRFSFETWNLLVSRSAFHLGQDIELYRLVRLPVTYGRLPSRPQPKASVVNGWL